ncbi:hypothetical protein O3P69_020698 [Scylla paramamosain]|uniref:Sphingomyelin phosphodiesterase n=2 Tax=Scylla paramamosain TaxID=85552 RepID=A0AAW0TQM3_SCYPA
MARTSPDLNLLALLLCLLFPLHLGSPLTSKDWDFHENDISYDHATPTTQEEKERVEKFDISKLNYTAILLELEKGLNAMKKREGRFLEGPRLPRFFTDLGKFLDLEQVVNEIETSIMSTASCTACKVGVGMLQKFVQNGMIKEDIIKAASGFCISLRIETTRVCLGIVNLMADEVVYVVENLVMSPDEICGFVIGDICGIPYNPYHKWKVAFPPVQKPPVQHPKSSSTGMPTLKVLHLSDTHYDPEYQEGSNADCDEPLCCRASSGPVKSPGDRAGYWGDYRKCDTPSRTIHSMLQHIAQAHPDIDYIIWTGDLPPHDIWNQTREGNLDVIRATINQMMVYFPKTPIFPALGNHESAPVNSFPPPFVMDNHGVGWLYEELAYQWQRWLPEASSPTIRKGAFYSVLVRPGFRIISLNMNYCNNKNWWLLLNSTDPAQELQWLIYELQNAEDKGEKVHILGHIPPGHSDCLKVWSHNYYTIVNRYEATITAQFFGHTHYDEFELFYDENDRHRVTNIAYIGPSVTSYYKLNPGYRIYYVEGEFPTSQKVVTDHETWVMNLEEANRYGHPRWYQLYSARRAYNMRNLLPEEWNRLVYKMALDDNLFRKYQRFYWKNSVAREDCDSECKKRMLCDLKSGRSNDRKYTCAKITEQVEIQERTDWTDWIYSGFSITSLAVVIPVAAVVIPNVLYFFFF